MPPAPWQTGIPLIAAERKFAAPNVVASLPGRTRAARSPKYTRAASAVARHEFANESGTCGIASTVSAVQNIPESQDGKCSDDGPSEALPPARTTATTAPIATSASETGKRRSANASTTTTSASGSAHREETA